MIFLFNEICYISIMAHETDERITALEIKLAYMEDFLNELQRMTVEHGNILEKVVAENEILKDKVKELVEDQEEDMPNIRPPNY